MTTVFARPLQRARVGAIGEVRAVRYLAVHARVEPALQVTVGIGGAGGHPTPKSVKQAQRLGAQRQL